VADHKMREIEAPLAEWWEDDGYWNIVPDSKGSLYLIRTESPLWWPSQQFWGVDAEGVLRASNGNEDYNYGFGVGGNGGTLLAKELQFGWKVRKRLRDTVSGFIPSPDEEENLPKMVVEFLANNYVHFPEYWKMETRNDLVLLVAKLRGPSTDAVIRPLGLPASPGGIYPEVADDSKDYLDDLPLGDGYFLVSVPMKTKGIAGYRNYPLITKSRVSLPNKITGNGWQGEWEVIQGSNLKQRTPGASLVTFRPSKDKEGTVLYDFFFEISKEAERDFEQAAIIALTYAFEGLNKYGQVDIEGREGYLERFRACWSVENWMESEKDREKEALRAKAKAVVSGMGTGVPQSNAQVEAHKESRKGNHKTPFNLPVAEEEKRVAYIHEIVSSPDFHTIDSSLRRGEVPPDLVGAKADTLRHFIGYTRQYYQELDYSFEVQTAINLLTWMQWVVEGRHWDHTIDLAHEVEEGLACRRYDMQDLISRVAEGYTLPSSFVVGWAQYDGETILQTVEKLLTDFDRKDFKIYGFSFSDDECVEVGSRLELLRDFLTTHSPRQGPLPELYQAYVESKHLGLDLVNPLPDNGLMGAKYDAEDGYDAEDEYPMDDEYDAEDEYPMDDEYDSEDEYAAEELSPAVKGLRLAASNQFGHLAVDLLAAGAEKADWIRAARAVEKGRGHLPLISAVLVSVGMYSAKETIPSYVQELLDGVITSGTYDLLKGKLQGLREPLKKVEEAAALLLPESTVNSYVTEQAQEAAEAETVV